MKKPQNFDEVTSLLARLLKDQQYAFRGTTSLVLQGLDMNVDDIDILCDKKTALACNDILKEYSVETVTFKESPQFKSYYGKFSIKRIQVEIMGEWQIRNNKKNIWSNPFSASPSEITKTTFKDQKVPVTTIQTELLMFSSMGRWNAYHKILRQTKSKLSEQPHLL